MSLKEMPKIELHVHLDGSMRLETASELSSRPVEEIRDAMVAPSKCFDLSDYLTRFAFPISLLQTKDNLTRVAKELALDLREDGVMYAEIRFAPIFHTEKNLSLEEVVDAVLMGLNQVDIPVGVILCLMRNVSKEDNIKTIEVAEKYLNKGVVGLDLAGDEKAYPTRDFREYFELIKEKQIPFTIHAGEADGKESLSSALDLGTKRIGHGVRVIEDNDLLNTVRNRRTVLEVCPTSNIQTNVIETYKDHPIKKLFENHILVTVNTDNRTVSNITLTEEYNKLKETFNFSLLDFRRMNLDAIYGAFLTNEQKDELVRNYLGEFSKFLEKVE